MRLRKEIREKKILEKKVKDLESETQAKQRQFKDKFGDPIKPQGKPVPRKSILDSKKNPSLMKKPEEEEKRILKKDSSISQSLISIENNKPTNLVPTSGPINSY
jgi:hypothetical protein